MVVFDSVVVFTGRMELVLVSDSVVVFTGRMELVLVGASVKVVLGLSGGGEMMLLAEMGDSEVVGVIGLLRDEVLLRDEDEDEETEDEETEDEEIEDEETWDRTRMLGQ